MSRANCAATGRATGRTSASATLGAVRRIATVRAAATSIAASLGTVTLVVLCACYAFFAGPAAAMPSVDASAPRTATPGSERLFARIGFDQHLDTALPLDARFVDDTGRATTLGDALGGRPAVLLLDVYDCPNLCSIVRHGAFEALRQAGFGPDDVRVVSISIDPRETPALAATRKVEDLAVAKGHVDPAAVRYLTGDAGAIARVAAAAGFRFAWDDTLRQYAHAAGLVVVTPDGRIARYLFGARFPAMGLRLALVEAAAGRIGSLADQVWLLCYHYDPVQGRYGLVVRDTLQLAGGALVVVLVGAVAIALRRERRRRKAPADRPEATPPDAAPRPVAAVTASPHRTA